MTPMTARLTTLLMFAGQAQEAMRFYVSLLPDGKVESIARYGPGQPGAEGSVKHAVFRLGGQRLTCIDSPVKQPFTFTPAMSLVLACPTEPELDDLYHRLSEGGTILVPLDSYPFNPRFGWVTDRFDVSWQLSLRLPGPDPGEAGDAPVAAP
jgi:predicted 3-demethylubiquinone-9 3-methyltransferase (glyoxalase superfamily)